jgi:hypothetical protein
MRSEPAEDAATAAAMATSSETTELAGCWEQHEGSDESSYGGRRSRIARRSRPVPTVAPELDLTDSSSVSKTELSAYPLPPCVAAILIRGSQYTGGEKQKYFPNI